MRRPRLTITDAVTACHRASRIARLCEGTLTPSAAFRWVLVSVMVLVLSGRLAVAEVDVRMIEQLIIEDCNDAGMMLGHLSTDQMKIALEILVRSVRLGIPRGGYPTGVHRPFISTSPGVAAPGHGELAGDVVLMSLDPERDKRARQCSMELLRVFLSRSPSVLGQLVLLAEEKDLADADPELVEEITNLVLAVAGQVAPSMSAAEKSTLVSVVVSHDRDEVLEQWKLLLRIFPEEAIRQVGRRALNSRRRDSRLLELLRGLDPTLQQSFDLIADVVSGFEAGRTERALEWMEFVDFPRDQVITLLITTMAGASPRKTTLALQSFSKITEWQQCSTPVALDESLALMILQSLSSSSIALREWMVLGAHQRLCGRLCEAEPLQRGLLGLWCAPEFVGLYWAVVERLIGVDSDLLGNCLPSIASLPMPTSEILPSLRQLLGSSHQSVWLPALSIYGELASDRGRLVSDSLRLLKRPTLTPDGRRAVVEEIARAFLSPPIGVRGVTAIPYFLDVFEESLDECGALCEEDDGGIPLVARAIGAVGPGAFPMLIRSLESENEGRRRRALQSLSQLRELDHKMASFLVGGLRDSAVPLRALTATLIRQHVHNEAVRTELRKAAAWADPDASARAASLLSNPG